MDNICNIKYVDARFSYAESIGEAELLPQEAYGYALKNKSNIVIFFIKKRDEDVEEIIRKGQNIIKGLIIPEAALLSIYETYDSNILKDIHITSKVSITWLDVRYVANMPEYDCATMHSEGVVHRIEKDRVIIQNPQTTRIHPSPYKKHPENETPTFLILPISFITHIETAIPEAP